MKSSENKNISVKTVLLQTYAYKCSQITLCDEDCFEISICIFPCHIEENNINFLTSKDL